jgi:hypothetical protein
VKPRPLLPPTRAGRRGLAMRLGLWLVLLAAFFPMHGCRAHPRQYAPPYEKSGFFSDETEESHRFLLELPELARRFLSPAPDESTAGAVIDCQWYGPYLLLPLWAGALAALRFGRRGRLAGRALVLAGLAGGILVILFAVQRDMPGANAWILTGIGLGVFAWCWFGPARWSRLDPRPMICAQAMGLLLYALHFPVKDAWKWLPRHPPLDVARAIFENYLVGYVLLVAGLALVAVPGYLPRRRRGLRGAPVLEETTERTGHG